MPPNVPRMEIGTAMPGISVARKLRKKAKTTSVTNVIAIRSVSSVSRNESRMVVLRSMATVTLTSAGMAACKCGNDSFTLSMVSMMLAPGWRKTMTSTDGWPLDRPRLRTSSTESFTAARSDNCTAAPLR